MYNFTIKKVLTIVLLILAVRAISVIVTWTNGFRDFEIKELNPDLTTKRVYKK